MKQVNPFGQKYATSHINTLNHAKLPIDKQRKMCYARVRARTLYTVAVLLLFRHKYRQTKISEVTDHYIEKT